MSLLCRWGGSWGTGRLGQLFCSLTWDCLLLDSLRLRSLDVVQLDVEVLPSSKNLRFRLSMSSCKAKHRLSFASPVSLLYYASASCHFKGQATGVGANIEPSKIVQIAARGDLEYLNVARYGDVVIFNISCM